MERRRLAMSKVVLNVSMSLDGFTTGPNVTEREPMGVGGEQLHEWMFAGAEDGVDAGVRRETDAMVGATIIGRRTFDLGLGPWGGTPWPGIPSFVVSHRTREDLLGDNGGRFAFDGLEAAGRGPDLDLHWLGAAVLPVPAVVVRTATASTLRGTGRPGKPRNCRRTAANGRIPRAARDRFAVERRG